MCIQREIRGAIQPKVVRDGDNIILIKRFDISDGIKSWIRDAKYHFCKDTFGIFAKENNKMQDVEYYFSGEYVYGKEVGFTFTKKKKLGYHASFFDNKTDTFFFELKSIVVPIIVKISDIQDFDENAVVCSKFYLMNKETLIRFFKKYNNMHLFCEKGLLLEQQLEEYAEYYQKKLYMIAEKTAEVL